MIHLLDDHWPVLGRDTPALVAFTRATGRLIEAMRACRRPIIGAINGIAVGAGSVWVTGQATGTVTRIDERSGTVLEPIHAGSGADAVAVGAGAVWVANTLDSTVTRIRPGTNAVVSTISVGDGPSGIAVAPGSVWVSNAFAGTLSRIDPGRNVSVQTVTGSLSRCARQEPAIPAARFAFSARADTSSTSIPRRPTSARRCRSRS